MTKQSIAMPGTRASHLNQQHAFDGAALSPATFFLIACGTFGGILFTTVYLIEGATRPGYDALQQPISALSLGLGGWVQQANFIIFGILMIISALGWRAALFPGRGALGYPLLKIASGVGLIMDGIFSQDAGRGYPPGAQTTSITVSGQIHNIFASICITAIAAGCYVLAARFVAEPRWRWWALYAALTGIATMALIATFGAQYTHPGSPAGLFERLSPGVDSLLGILIFVRLLMQARGHAQH
jgi:hypothetical protein